MPRASRPQDEGRDPGHRRRGIPSADTLAILERYRAALRAELADVLTTVRDRPPADLEERMRLWRHARQLAGELVTGSDVPAALTALGAQPSAARRRPPRLTARDRAALG
jgi:hypothetical protein